ncbi:MAG: type II secretion system protein [Chloroherpetonaceae bacterium]|nr:type II secretion system GspH family protein [Chthonomonadaceae bacterium]MDW8206603.1 type II secretion system protein [Chloroherpetonaceae bacterium]
MRGRGVWRRRLAFTLVELLVVIAIVSVLAALLFPVYAQAREKARQSSCTSQMRQMNMAVTLYLQDYDERFPLAASATTTGFLNWHHFVEPYARNRQIWACPSAALPVRNSYGNLVCHYGFNAYYLNEGVVPADVFTLNNAPGVAMASVQDPSRTVLLTDNIGIPGRLPANRLSTYVLPPSQRDADFWGRPDPRHNAGVLVGRADSGVKWMRPDAFYHGQTPPDLWFDRE